MLTSEIAQNWLSRWDRQQEGYLPDREDRFTSLIDAVEAGVGRPDPLVLDLGCGPGSLSVRLLDRLPEATVVAIDTDPVLLALGRAGYGGRTGLRFAEHDLSVPGWSDALGLDRPADAAVSTTALHWISVDGLRTVYGELGRALRPGGLFLNGDHLRVEDTTPGLAELERALPRRAAERRFADGPPEDWAQWWDAIAEEPTLAELARSHQTGSGHHAAPSELLSSHVTALRDAGFAEVGTLWQRGDDRLLCAIRPH